MTVTALFFMWGFITCMNDLLIPKFKADFSLTQFQANLVQFAFFGAYFVVSLIYFLISAAKGDPINKIGYKNGLVLGLIVAGIGCTLFYPAAETKLYPLFLGALIVLGAGVTIIQIAANPYVTILGPEKTAPSRLNLSQGLNSLGYVIAPLIGGILLFGSNVYQSGGGVARAAASAAASPLKRTASKAAENVKSSFSDGARAGLGVTGGSSSQGTIGGTSVAGVKARRDAGIASSACCPRSSMAQATASVRSLAWNTPLIARRWLFKPSSRNSPEVCAASLIAPLSGRVTRITVVFAGSLKASSAALKRTSCIFKPECGPRQEAPRSLPSRKPVHALGRLSSRSVCPVGAVSKTMWS